MDTFDIVLLCMFAVALVIIIATHARFCKKRLEILGKDKKINGK